VRYHIFQSSGEQKLDERDEDGGGVGVGGR
jgi:hypothetical protein